VDQFFQEVPNPVFIFRKINASNLHKITVICPISLSWDIFGSSQCISKAKILMRTAEFVVINWGYSLGLEK
jgi:hypothetical protein